MRVEFLKSEDHGGPMLQPGRGQLLAYLCVGVGVFVFLIFYLLYLLFQLSKLGLISHLFRSSKVSDKVALWLNVIQNNNPAPNHFYIFAPTQRRHC